MTIKTRYSLILAILAIFAALTLSTCFTSYTGDTGTLIIKFSGENSRMASFEKSEISAFEYEIIMTGPDGKPASYGKYTNSDLENGVSFDLIIGIWDIEVKAIGKKPKDGSYESPDDALSFPSSMLRAMGWDNKEIKAGPNNADIQMKSAIEVTNEWQLGQAIDLANDSDSKEEIILISDNISIDGFQPIVFTPYSGLNITFIAEKKVTIGWKSGYSPSMPLITINDDDSLTLGRKGMPGELIIEGSTSIPNFSKLINVYNGNLIMEEGVTIQNGQGGAVIITGFPPSYGSFTMNGGTIGGNKTGSGNSGGGVYVDENGKFTMIDGNISNNEAEWGGGVYVYNGGEFNMEGGTISGNTAERNGGGVYVSGGGREAGKFLMQGGTISGNEAGTTGGGVYLEGEKSLRGKDFGIIEKTGGIIYGNNTDKDLNNKVTNGEITDESKPTEINYGYAIFVDCFFDPSGSEFKGTKKIRDSTAGENDNLYSDKNGGWVTKTYP